VASPLTPRTVHPSSLAGDAPSTRPRDPHLSVDRDRLDEATDVSGGGGAGLIGVGLRDADLLRPSPPRSLVDRVLERLEPHLPAGLRPGDPTVRPSASAFPDDGDDDAGDTGVPLGVPPTPGGRGRLVARALVVAVAAAVAWWLLRPPPAPVEAVLPLAGETAGDGRTSNWTTAGEGVAGAEPDPGATARAGAAPDPGGAASAGDAADPGGPGAASPAGGGDPSASSSALVVQAAGAVVHPGVYRVPAGSRVDDLVRAAGGVRLDADLDRVNLAAPVHDGERVWVPRVGEEVAPPVIAGGGSVSSPAAPGGGAGGGADAGSPGEPTAPIDLNTATAEQLDTLPGVGPVTAAAIVAHRDEHGPFGSVDDLLDVRGIGEAKLEQLRPLVRV
jgi:competence protein ComEA